MPFPFRTFCLAKDPAAPEQNQDSWSLNIDRGLAAVADGVSSAIFSGPWARLLTAATVDEPPPLTDTAAFQAWLTRLRSAWSAGIDPTKITWYQRPKMVDGGMSTLLWIEWSPLPPTDDGAEPGYKLLGYAIGDTCLYHLRDKVLLRAFPMATAVAFGANPQALRSVDRKVDHLLEFQAFEDTCLPGDLLVLCTDAIALWAMNRYEAGEEVDWEKYWDMPHEAWVEEIESLRLASLMRYDDSTLVLLRVVPVGEMATEEEQQPTVVDDSASAEAAAAETAPLESESQLTASLEVASTADAATEPSASEPTSEPASSILVQGDADIAPVEAAAEGFGSGETIDEPIPATVDESIELISADAALAAENAASRFSAEPKEPHELN